MDESMPTMPEDRPTRQSERVDELCDRYEAAWRAGTAPRVEDFLAEVEAADRAALVRELLALEQELRGKRRERAAVQDYLERLPEHADVIRAVFGVAPTAGAEPAARPQGDTGRDLLFGILALQNNFIGRDDLVAAFAVWVAEKARLWPNSWRTAERSTRPAERCWRPWSPSTSGSMAATRRPASRR
jgi:hypothetical protein